MVHRVLREFAATKVKVDYLEYRANAVWSVWTVRRATQDFQDCQVIFYDLLLFT
jgi:hypothetical protein